MSSTVRACPSCKTTLPADAIFCHKCGTSTPMGINAHTGEIHAPELSALVEEQARQAILQAALGDSVEVRRLLGRGGFAEVYVAYDRRLKREIAVKTIRGDLVVNDMLLERFQREAEAVAKLRHPHVIPIYSVGESNGVAYFTMPLIEGQSLAELLDREGRVSVAEGTRILREAANALHAAHRTGLVHRDIKPENIMLEGPERTAVVMDFGIAKSEGPEAKGLTGTGMLVGTPQYMSPEQATGERALDARSDQYSLAMVGYRMLTGRFPFTGDTVQQLIFKTVTEVPVPASDLSSDVPRDLSSVLARALSKAPNDRYESMAEFAAALTATERDAHTGPSSPGFRRQEADMATRLQQGLARLPRPGHPLVALALAGLIGGLVVHDRLTSDVGTNLAKRGSEAVFAAKSFLSARGVDVTAGAYPSFVTREHAREWLSRAVGAEAIERRAASDIPVWLWSVKFGKLASGYWSVDVGPQNRVIGFQRFVLDSATLPSISHDSARVLAEREVLARGWAPGEFRLVTDSTITRRRRVDHFFRWRRDASTVVNAAGDSSFLQASTTVRGDQVADYAANLRLPDSHEAEHDVSIARSIVAGLGWATVAVLAAFALGLGVSRQHVDRLQWGVGIRLLAFTGLALCLLGLPLLLQEIGPARDGADIVGAFLGMPIMVATVGAALFFIAVVGESLAREHHPTMVRGLDDMSRGRLAIPEVMSSVLWGYVAGFTAMGLFAVIDFAAYHALGRTATAGKVSVVFGMWLPSTFAIVLLAASMVGAIAVMYPVAFFARYRATSRVKLILPAIIAAAMFSAASDMTPVTVGLTVLVASFAIWHFGFLAGVIAMWVPEVIKEGVQLLTSGTVEFMSAGLVTIALALAPLVFAMMLVRRYRLAA